MSRYGDIAKHAAEHLERASHDLGIANHPTSDGAGNAALCSIAHSILAIGGLLGAAFVDEFVENGDD